MESLSSSLLLATLDHAPAPVTLASALLSQSSITGQIVLSLLMFVFGGLVAYGIFTVSQRRGQALREAEAERVTTEAAQRAEDVVRTAEVEAKRKYLESKERFEQESATTREELRGLERRLSKREDTLDRKMDVLDTKEAKIEKQSRQVAEREASVEQAHQEAEALKAQQHEELLRVSQLSPDQAKSLTLDRLEQQLTREAGLLTERIVGAAEEQAKERAREIIITAIERYAAEHTGESTVSAVDVASDDMKGRVIGREGRNIRAFEKATGVTVIVDDTPGVISITATDPVRREVARVSLDKLIRDGRIHPTRIEEIVEAAQKDIDKQIVEAGQKAALEANVNGLNKRVTNQLGRLVYRTSYGQNVLRHSVEVAYLCGMMADELGLDGALARRCGLLHDIGKGFAHDEGLGAHTKVGADFCKRFNESEAVLNAVEGHHGDIPATTPYTPLVMAADAISAARPGARRESLERYIKRLEELEGIATGFDGVAEAHAVEAGREIRVIVDAQRTDDQSALKLARDIAKQIEENMTYPGEIRVTVLRELRAVDYAR